MTNDAILRLIQSLEKLYMLQEVTLSTEQGAAPQILDDRIIYALIRLLENTASLDNIKFDQGF